jgi:hypothetical protein
LAKAQKPKKVGEKSGRTIPAGKTQDNFNIDTNLLEKVKDLAHLTGDSRAAIYTKGAEIVIEKWEKKNGKIPQRPKSSGLDNL